MSKVKLCGLSRPCDIEDVNKLKPDFIGFIFAKKSKRYVSPEKAYSLKTMLDESIKAVGVFVREPEESVAKLLDEGIIDIAQLHGGESEEYIANLRKLTDKPLIQAFRIDTNQDIEKAKNSLADYVLLDSGDGGTGTTFDWSLIKNIGRPYFLAGGLGPENVAEAVANYEPYAVDVSSGIETDGLKDSAKMAAFVAAVRKEKTDD